MNKCPLKTFPYKNRRVPYVHHNYEGSIEFSCKPSIVHVENLGLEFERLCIFLWAWRIHLTNSGVVRLRVIRASRRRFPVSYMCATRYTYTRQPGYYIQRIHAHDCTYYLRWIDPRGRPFHVASNVIPKLHNPSKPADLADNRYLGGPLISAGLSCANVSWPNLLRRVDAITYTESRYRPVTRTAFQRRKGEGDWETVNHGEAP